MKEILLLLTNRIYIKKVQKFPEYRVPTDPKIDRKIIRMEQEKAFNMLKKNLVDAGGVLRYDILLFYFYKLISSIYKVFLREIINMSSNYFIKNGFYKGGVSLAVPEVLKFATVQAIEFINHMF